MTSSTIISLGGSLVAPDGLDIEFIRRFREIVFFHVKAGKHFIITVGGGKVCRQYQAAAKALGVSAQNDLDWIGIRALSLNAELLRAVFGDMAHDTVIINPSALTVVSESLAIFGANATGHSTDFDAVEAAREVGAKRVANLSNIDYAYDKDPRAFPDAKRIEKISWSKFRSDVLPAKWTPGVNAPFDPVAAKRAEELGLEVAIMNGKNLENFRNYLEGKEFVGTVIK